MFIKINQVRVSLDYQEADIHSAVVKKLHTDPNKIGITRILRRSVDARQRNDKPYFILSLLAELKDTNKLPRRMKNHPDVDIAETNFPQDETPKPTGTSKKVLVVGMGPAGLMAGITLARQGYKPLVIERGGDVSARGHAVGKFWTKGILDPENNALYGEGGAGLFSDGKLTARSKDRPRIKAFLETLVECGCDEEILIDAEPHIGSDVLKRVIANMREIIIQAGGEVRFNAKLQEIFIENGKFTGAKINGEDIPADACFLATGHSARDVYRMLYNAGVQLESKPFAVGVRLELPQKRIDKAQYGKFANHPRLGAASFRLTRKPTDNIRACYSFCMCPGGMVISCASAENEFTTNGMSNSARNLPYANAAFLVPVTPEDFPNSGPLAGIEYQQEIERKAFITGGEDYSIPACTLRDYLKGSGFKEIFHSRSCQRAVPRDIRPVLPDYVNQTLETAIPAMLKKMSSIYTDEVLLYAAETRSSAPVRIIRDDTGQSVNVKGLYPTGEGAGYAGGIVSSAVDAIKQAESFMYL